MKLRKLLTRRIALTALGGLISPILMLVLLIVVNDFLLKSVLSENQFIAAQRSIVAPYTMIVYFPLFLAGNLTPSSVDCNGCLASTMGFSLGLLGTWLYHVAFLNLVWTWYQRRDRVQSERNVQ